MNLAVQFLEHEDSAIDYYDGCCGDLVDDMMHWLGEDRIQIMYIKPKPGYALVRMVENSPQVFVWRYHMVAVIDGKVHDAWAPDMVLPPDEYIEAAFPGQCPEYDFPAERVT